MEDMIMIDRDERPQRNGWAAGDYFCRCSVCGAAYSGDKRSFNCAACAYNDWEPTHVEVRDGDEVVLKMTNVHPTFVSAKNDTYVVYEDRSGVLWVQGKEAFNAAYALK
jgi:hypothetical protein